MNRVLVLTTISRHSSKTAKLLRFYLNRLKKSQQQPFKVQLVNVYDLKILPCDGCGICKLGKTCPKNQSDDFEKIVNLVKNSNCFVVASAVYFLGFPAKLKAFVDRCEQFYCSKSESVGFKNLKLLGGHLVLTGGNLSFESLRYVLKCCRQFFACLDVEFKNCLVAPVTDLSGLFFLIDKLL